MTERRWAIIALDGRHVWLGRNSDPPQEEIARAEQQLIAQGSSAWLTVVSGDYWSANSKIEFLTVRKLSGDEADQWDEAKQSFIAARWQRLNNLD